MVYPHHDSNHMHHYLHTVHDRQHFHCPRLHSVLAVHTDGNYCTETEQGGDDEIYSRDSAHREKKLR